ncbi:hypothetical protein EJ04DRAFT_562474 [Polyplosphaeria fusca]|uniref:Uncharacterized protein n=1 Tax=Polyplosphaeria fusca TaxID=682080 RepID=A0A9P4V4P3_9PLEO|nr:hypothetical protein EJ04DRAFT_562474 [Polyplosphaeria fusca]
MKVNGEVLEKGGDNASVRMRFDVTGFGVLGRESMWVSASVANYDQCSSGKVDTGDCVNVLNNGLDFCNTDSIYTFGYTGQGENCVAYGVDVSSDMHDDNPPWQEAVDISYPPPENYFDEISCQYVDGSMPLREEDIQATIDDYCNIDGAFRPAGPDGWTSQGALDMEAAPNVDLAPEGDSRWCSDFDRNVNKDDSSYCTSSYRSALDAFTGPYDQIGTSTRVYIRKHRMTTTWQGTPTVIISAESTLATDYETYVMDAIDLVQFEKPCCGRCALGVDTVHLWFWPDSATASSASAGSPPKSYVDEEGFTFFSPSVYVAFIGLYATDSCGPVGTTVASTTVAFDLSDIRTLGVAKHVYCSEVNDSPFWDFLPAVTDLSETVRPPRPLTISDLMQNCSTDIGYYFNENDPNMFYYDEDPCHPYIDIPSEIYVLHPDWTHYTAEYGGGFHDPPRTLQPRSVLVPSATPIRTSPKQPATPGQTVPQVASPTTNLNPDNTLSTKRPDIGPSSNSIHDINPLPVRVSSTNVQRVNSQRIENDPHVRPLSTAIDDQTKGSPVHPVIITIDPPTNTLPIPSNQTITLLPAQRPASLNPILEETPENFTDSPLILIVLRSPSLQIPGDTTTLFLINGQTLTSGQAITLGSQTKTTVFLDPAATQLIASIDGLGSIDTLSTPLTFSLLRTTNTPLPIPTPSLLRIESKNLVYTLLNSNLIYTINENGDIIIETQTLHPGTVIVAGGTTVTLSNGERSVRDGTTASRGTGPGGLVVGGWTVGVEATATSTAETGGSVGGAVRSTVGGSRTAATGTSGLSSGSSGMRGCRRWVYLGAGIVALGLLV